MTTYYNEIDPDAASWLEELMLNDLIPHGVVDRRDLRDVTPNDLRGFKQCHFFAGIGGWPLALRLAGWPDTRPVWTGSCPCQPFSAAGQGVGFADERHLWPSWWHLIQESEPELVFGEQVASKDGLDWFDLVQTDLESARYSVGSSDLCAAGVGAPQIRQRLWFVGVADRDDTGSQGWWQPRRERALERFTWPGGVVSGLADADGGERGRVTDTRSGNLVNRTTTGRFQGDGESEPDMPNSRLADAAGFERDRGGNVRSSGWAEPENRSDAGGTNQAHTPWRNADWLYCRDEKWRPVEPGTFPLAPRIPARVGRLRGYGNAIVPSVAKIWIESVMESL